jgi:hypothetical protein
VDFIVPINLGGWIKMKQLILPATGFEMEVPDNFYYHDDGVVDSIAKHTRDLCRSYGNDPKYTKMNFIGQRLAELLQESRLDSKIRKIMNRTDGYSIRFYSWKKYDSMNQALRSGDQVNFHIYLLRNRNDQVSTCIRGHEETHLPLNFGREDLIISKWASFGLGTQGFEDLPLEAKCDIGGICATLNKFGNDTSSITWNSGTNKELIRFLRLNTNWGINLK